MLILFHCFGVYVFNALQWIETTQNKPNESAPIASPCAWMRFYSSKEFIESSALMTIENNGFKWSVIQLQHEREMRLNSDQLVFVG